MKCEETATFWEAARFYVACVCIGMLAVVITTGGCSKEPKEQVYKVHPTAVEMPNPLKNLDLTPAYRVRLTVSLTGKDGLAVYATDTTMPFLPREGDRIDMFTVGKVVYGTRDRMFTVLVNEWKDKEATTEKMLGTLEVATPGKWQRLMYAAFSGGKAK